MGNDWDDTPPWVRQGRTGPGELAPRYAHRKDRARVKRDYRRSQGSGCGIVVLMVLTSVVLGLGIALHHLLPA